MSRLVSQRLHGLADIHDEGGSVVLSADVYDDGSIELIAECTSARRLTLRPTMWRAPVQHEDDLEQRWQLAGRILRRVNPAAFEAMLLGAEVAIVETPERELPADPRGSC